jgi:hypothetical protein
MPAVVVAVVTATMASTAAAEASSSSSFRCDSALRCQDSMQETCSLHLKYVNPFFADTAQKSMRQPIYAKSELSLLHIQNNFNPGLRLFLISD